MNLSIIIVHYKTLNLTKNCLKSLENLDRSEIECIIVDNNSLDNAKNSILNEFPWVKWITNEVNEGFGCANNKAVKIAKGENILFLNSDVICNQNAIDVCLKKIKQNTNIGAIGCKLYYPNGKEQNSRYFHDSDYLGILKMNHFYSKWYKKPKVLKAIMGSFMMIPKNVFKQLGGFDENYFMYCEEIELCKRIRSLNLQIEYTEECSVIHVHGASSKKTGTWTEKQSLLSLGILFRKSRGSIGYIIFHSIILMNFISYLVIKAFKRNQDYSNDKQLYKSYFSTLKYFWKILLKFRKGNKLKYLKYE